MGRYIDIIRYRYHFILAIYIWVFFRHIDIGKGGVNPPPVRACYVMSHIVLGLTVLANCLREHVVLIDTVII